MKIKIIFLVSVFLSLFFYGCFSAWEGGQSTLTVSVGGGSNSRQIWNGLKTTDFLHVITITNSMQKQETRFIGGQTASFTVTAGVWNVDVKAYFFPNGFPKTDNIEEIEITDTFPLLVANGSTSVQINPGPNEVNITMTENTDNNNLFFVKNEEGWNDARNKIANGGNDKEYFIIITDDFEVDGSDDSTFGSNIDITVTIIGNHTLSLKSKDSISTDYYLLRIDKEQDKWQKVIIQDVKLKGINNNYSSLVLVLGEFTMRGCSSVSDNVADNSGGGVVVIGGVFTMKDNSSVFNNKAASDKGGGGVVVEPFIDNNNHPQISLFTMEDTATIYNNNAKSGGGVYVENSTFIMTGGTIYGNNTSESGGGVYINSSTFNMAGGTIYGSDNSEYTNKVENPNQTSTSGIALYVYGNATAQYGKIDENDIFVPTVVPTTGNNKLTTTDETIEVKDGILYLGGKQQ